MPIKVDYKAIRLNESLIKSQSKSMIRALKSMIRALKGRNKATGRGEDILVENNYGLVLISLTSG